MPGKLKTYLILGAITIFTIYIIKRKKGKSNFKNKLVDLANDEYNKWNKNGIKIKEGAADTLQTLRNYYEQGANVKNSDNYYISTPWSATFISYLMKKAGAENDFKYNLSHSEYIREAVQNRKANNSKKFKAYLPNEVPVEVGDLVCYPRQSGVGYNSTGNYASHCDLIISVNNNTAVGIGGNVSNSVSKSNYALKNGKIDKDKDKNAYGGVFTVIKNLK
jgi:hypothetical protein